MKIQNKFWQKWAIAVKLIPFLLIVATLKTIVHILDYEIMDLNALFTSLVAGTIFLIGFLVSGVLTDYKESEKIPSELSASLRALFDDSFTLNKSKNSEAALKFIHFQKSFHQSLKDWLYKKERTQTILTAVVQMNEFFIDLDKEGVQAPYITKLKNEQNNIRKIILRIDTIRDTNFIGSAYAIVEAMGFLIAVGLIIINITPFYASLFFTLIVVFLIGYMFLLVKDLDNPFDYSIIGESGTEISLKPLNDFIESVKKEV